MRLRLGLAATVAVIALGVAPAGVLAQTPDNYVGTVEQPTNLTNQPANQLGESLVRTVRPASVPHDPGLPVTGGDIAGLTVIGLAAVGSGVLLVRRSRRVHKQA